MPSGKLTIDASGNLYGTTYYGGEVANLERGAGVVFKLTRNADKTWAETVLHKFCQEAGCTDGQNPYAGLLMDSTGSLTGATLRGRKKCGAHDPCRVAFKISPNGEQSSYSVLHNFCGKKQCGDGQGPEGEFAMDSAGTLFGATLLGGANRAAPYFSCTADRWRRSTVSVRMPIAVTASTLLAS